jgi:D-arabinose 1-dehydrogenase-like Zn-dependent alcohol dehydrogenase
MNDMRVNMTWDGLFHALTWIITLVGILLLRSAAYAGTAKDSQDTLAFSVLSAVHPMIEKYPLDRVAEAYEQMHSGRARFRVVLTFDA